MCNFNENFSKFSIEANNGKLFFCFIAVFIVFMVLSGGNLKAQNLNGISIRSDRDKVSLVNTSIVKSFNNHMISCGDGYFWMPGEDFIDNDKMTHKYGKFIPENNDFYIKEAKIQFPKQIGNGFSSGDTICNSVNISGKSFFIVSGGDIGQDTWIVSEDNIFPAFGDVHIINYNRVIIYCNTDICIDRVNKINNIMSTNIESRKMHRHMKSVYESFGDDIIVYAVSKNYNFNPFDIKIYPDDDNFNIPDGVYCSLSEHHDKINLEINVINICSVLSSKYAGDSITYYENGNYYYFPLHGESRYAEFYECRGLNSCAGYVFPEEAQLQHENYWASEGKITTFGNFTTRYSDGYGPDYIFCLSRQNKSRVCIQKIYPNVVSKEEDDDDENDYNSEELRLFSAGGKYYFYTFHEKDGIVTSNIEEIITPF